MNDMNVDNLSAPVTPASSTSTRGNSSSVNMSRPQSTSRRRKLSRDDQKTNEVMELVGKKLNSLPQEDVFDVFGKHIANKLRSLNNVQNVFAHKLINDVLFEAEMENLSRSFQVVDMGVPHNNFGTTGGSYGWQPRWQECPSQPPYHQTGQQPYQPSQQSYLKNGQQPYEQTGQQPLMPQENVDKSTDVANFLKSFQAN